MAVCPIPDSLKRGMNRRANSLEWWEDAYLQMIITQQNMIKVIWRPFQDWGIGVRKSVSGVYAWYSSSVASASDYFSVSQVNLVELHTLATLTFFSAKQRRKLCHILFKTLVILRGNLTSPLHNHASEWIWFGVYTSELPNFQKTGKISGDQIKTTQSLMSQPVYSCLLADAEDRFDVFILCCLLAFMSLRIIWCWFLVRQLSYFIYIQNILLRQKFPGRSFAFFFNAWRCLVRVMS